MKNIILILISFALVFAVGCRKDIDETMTVETPHTPVYITDYTPQTKTVTSSVHGTVIDEAGEPVEGAIVTLGSTNLLTDRFGSFRFENMTMNEFGTFVEVEKEGYFRSGRRFYPKEGNDNAVRVELLELSYNSLFDSDSGGTVSIQGDGGSIVFAPNSIQNSAGNIYTGTVEVATKWLAPDAFSTFDQMPGALQGVDADNNEVGLVTLGMIGVELRGSNGEKLNIAEGSKAQIKVNVPASLQSAAPAEIPLWSFSYTYGMWVEESVATLQNGQYVGEVTHFSFWNCDLPSIASKIILKVVDKDTNRPITGIKVGVKLSNNLGVAYGLTDNNGIVSGFVPKDELLILEIYSYCGEVLYSQDIGPFEGETEVDLGVFEISTATVQMTGSILDCEGELVNDGLVNVKMNGQFFQYWVDSNPFLITIPSCQSVQEIEVSGGNLDEGYQGEWQTIPYTPEMDLGELESCGEQLLGFYKLTVDKTKTVYYPIYIVQAPDTINASHPHFFPTTGQANVDTIQLSIGFGGIVAGDYSDTHFVDVIVDTRHDWLFVQPFDYFYIDEYGEYNNSIISGRMYGDVANTNSIPATQHYVEASFRVIRNQ